MKTLPQRQAQPPIGNYLEGEQSSDIRHEYLAGQVLVPDVTALLALKIVSNGGLGLPLG